MTTDHTAVLTHLDAICGCTHAAQAAARGYRELMVERDALHAALTGLVANQEVAWAHAGFTEDQIKAMPYLRASREALAGFAS